MYTLCRYNIHKVQEGYVVFTNLTKTKSMGIEKKAGELNLRNNKVIKGCIQDTYVGAKIACDGRDKNEIRERIGQGKGAKIE